MSGTIAQGSQGVNLAQLISAISPILLGSGGQSGNTNGSTTSEGGTTTTSTQTQQRNADPGTLAALLGVAQNATNNSQNPDITNSIVQNIFRQSAEAFAPTIGTSASSGLYGTTTLDMLSNDARARATAQASSAVLNYKTAQDQIASGALSNILSQTGSTTGTNTSTTRTENAGTTKGTTFNITAPSLSGSSLLQSAGGIAASVLGKKALDAASPFLTTSSDNIASAAGDTISNAYHALFGASGLSGDRTFSAPSNFAASTGNDTLASAGQAPDTSSIATGVTTQTAEQGVDIASSVPGVDFTDTSSGLTSADLSSANGIPAGISPDQITVEPGATAANDIATPGTAESLSAPTNDLATSASTVGSETGVSVTPGVISDTAAEPGVAGIGSSLANTGGGEVVAGLEGPTADTVSSTVASGGDFFDNAISGGSGLVSDLQGAFDSAGNFISGAVDAAGNFIDAAGNVISSLGNDAAQGIGDLVGSLGNAVDIGSSVVGGIGSFGLGEVFKGAFGQEAGGALSTAASIGSGISGAFGGPTIGGTIAAGLGDLGGALGIGSTLGEVGATAASIYGSAAAGISEGISAIGSGAAVSSFFAEAWPLVLAFVGWVVCTELKLQGKLDEKLYRYGMIKFSKYNYWGIQGYLVWGSPVAKWIKQYPDGKITAIFAWLFTKRAQNIAYHTGYKKAKWTIAGMLASFAVWFPSAIVGIYLCLKAKINKHKMIVVLTSYKGA